MRMSKVKLNLSEISLRRVVPNVFKKLICSAYHDTIWSGAHLGRDKTYEKIKRKFFWYKMKEFISKYCNCCLSCLAHKNPKEWSKAKLCNIETSYPWDLVCVGILGPFPTTPNGNKNILTVICGFSKFVFILPIPNKKGATIAKTLFVKVFSVLGMPARLHSDRGKEFTNKILKNMLNLLGIAQSTTTAYHPQGNAYYLQSN